MIVEAPMWLLLPIAACAWLAYFVMVLTERRERADVDRRAEQRAREDAAEHGDQGEGEPLRRHGRRVAPLPVIPPGIPSITERLDRWT
jgi:hypothetical protein